MSSPTKPCPKCKTNRIPANRRLCNTCRKHGCSNSASRPTRGPIAQSILSRITANGDRRQPSLFVCTEDILILRGLRGYEADPETFRQASDLASLYNAYYQRTYANAN